MKRLKLQCGWVLVAAGLLWTTARAADPAEEKIVARGKGVVITLQDLDDAFDRMQTGMINVGKLPAPEARETFRSQLLDRLLFLRLCEARSTEADRVRARFETKALIDGFKNQAQSPEDFDRQLARAGYTVTSITREKYEEALANTVVDRELKATLKPTPEALQQRYDREPERWTVPESVKVAHLLVSTRNPLTGEELPEESRKQRLQMINDFRARVEKGEDFATLIRQHSDDTASRTRKGEYVVLRGQMVVEFEAAAFSLKPGQLSDVVTTQFGYHLIRLIEKNPTMHRDFSDVESLVREEWLADELKQRLPEYIRQLRKDAGVELTDLAPKPVTVAETK